MGIRVLHVDDVDKMRKFVVLLIQGLGAEVTDFGVLSEAKAAFASGKFDVVILDGSIQERYDGWRWAAELFTQGVRVMVYSLSLPPADMPMDLPSLKKGTNLQEAEDFFSRFLKGS